MTTPALGWTRSGAKVVKFGCWGVHDQVLGNLLIVSLSIGFTWRLFDVDRVQGSMRARSSLTLERY